MTALRSYAGSNVIVYSPTINRVEETVDFLEDQRHCRPCAYHGKMERDDAAAQSGTLDVGRSARAGGDDCFWLGHQ